MVNTEHVFFYSMQDVTKLEKKMDSIKTKENNRFFPLCDHDSAICILVLNDFLLCNNFVP